jgi:two-component system, chemotaxis family, protein-glutamate methylesterase/glutaminase
LIKVLVVEDSPTARELLVHILSRAGIRVIGVASDGKEAVEFVKRTRPDVVTMDIHMPGMNGIEATRRIMETNPVPIVIVSGNWDPREVEMTFQTMEAGALAIVQRPQGIGHRDYEAASAELVQKVRLMSEVKVVRRWSRQQPKGPDVANTLRSLPASAPENVKVVAIGASTGGPPVLQTILQGISPDFPAPILIVQHMAAGFLPGMVEWLRGTCRVPLKIAARAETALPGHAYVAPDCCHMGVDSGGRILLANDAPEHGARPSVSYLFRSAASSYGRNAVGILLTGMGIDGAGELKLLHERGAVTIAQSKETSVIYGMPAAAVELDAASYVLSPDQIVAALTALTKRDRRE